MSNCLRAQGTIYGISSTGGAFAGGVLFKANNDASGLSVVRQFPLQVSGSNTNYNQLILDPATGKFYGLTVNGGAYDKGTLFEYDPATNTHTLTYEFTSISGYCCKINHLRQRITGGDFYLINTI